MPKSPYTHKPYLSPDEIFSHENDTDQSLQSTLTAQPARILPFMPTKIAIEYYKIQTDHFHKLSNSKQDQNALTDLIAKGVVPDELTCAVNFPMSRTTLNRRNNIYYFFHHATAPDAQLVFFCGQWMRSVSLSFFPMMLMHFLKLTTSNPVLWIAPLKLLDSSAFYFAIGKKSGITAQQIVGLTRRIEFNPGNDGHGNKTITVSVLNEPSDSFRDMLGFPHYPLVLEVRTNKVAADANYKDMVSQLRQTAPTQTFDNEHLSITSCKF